MPDSSEENAKGQPAEENAIVQDAVENTPAQPAIEPTALQPAIEQQIRRRTFVSFSVFIGMNIAAFGAWKWLRNTPDELPGVTARAQQPLRQALETSEKIFRPLFSHHHLVKTYPKSQAAKNVRKNGNIGLKTTIDQAQWQLQVRKNAGDILKVNLEELRSLPKTELIFNFKCVEGWDQVQHWGGVKFADFISRFGLQKESAMEYAGFETPDNKYYVGIDIDSALHPQTLLAYEMNGRPLTSIHGAPLRLIIPVKYGIKSLKRIGSIFFSDQRPRDYWAEQGYDYYSGL